MGFRMHNDFYDCVHAWVDEWHPSLEHCTLKLDPCPGRELCESFIDCDEWYAIKRAEEEDRNAKLWLVADIPYDEVEEFAQKWFADHKEINILWGDNEKR